MKIWIIIFFAIAQSSFAQNSLKYILKAEFLLVDNQTEISSQYIDSVGNANYYSENLKGRIYSQLKDWDKAIVAFKKSNTFKTNYSDYELAKAYAKKLNKDSAFYYLKHHLDSEYKKKSNFISLDTNIRLIRNSSLWSELNLKSYYSKAETELEQAIYYKDKNELSLALDILDDLIVNDKNYADAYYYRAQFIIKLNKDYKYAFKDLKKAIKLEPSNDMFTSALSTYYLKGHKYKPALNLLKKEIILFPYNLQDYLLIAEAYYRTGDYDNAIGNINIYLDISFRNIDALKLAGQIYYDKGDYPASINLLTEAMYINMRRIDILVARGKSYLENDEYQRAGMDFNIALDLDPNNGELWYLKGLAYMYQEKMRQACKYFTKASYLNYYKAEEYLLKECQ